ncbi:MAG TPA: SusC/RagA family TonB-linked outer membrane protein [Saprospiraceae bacterium]|nr:SusC/RagA family TonB-linked outer membrane protein [Saprospiraceae bacterium]HMP23139.1 SusC/RagA family TonB-linked outer membrane protein [Saprospiraceae bacterium]
MTYTHSSRRLLLLVLLAMTTTIAFAQRISFSIKGTVTDDTGTPLIGVTVLLLEPRLGTVTDANGYYDLSDAVAEGTYTLQVSYVGYGSYNERVAINAATTNLLKDIRLGLDILELDQIVVTGNTATSTRRQLGNAIGVVGGEKLQNAGTTNTLAALSGKVMGAQITQNDGYPAGGISVRLRGPSSIKGSSDPLYIVDGVIVDNSSTNVINLSADAMTTGLQGGQNRLVDINPNDIERIEVLNGAAAAAIYGSRASNGVVQIFTKRGKSGKPTIEFSTSATHSSLRNRVFLTQHPERFGVPGNDRLELAQDRLTILLHLGPSEAVLQQQGVNFAKVGPVNRLLITDKYPVQRYDYQDDIFTGAWGTDNHLSVSGGNDKTNYFASFGYFNNDGIIKNTNFTKYTGRLRLNQTLANWASMSVGLSYNYSASQDMPNGNNFFSPISTMFIIDNVWNLNDRDAGGNLRQVEQVRVNPLSVLETFDLTQRTNRTISDIQFNLYPVQGLNINAIFGVDNYSLVGNEFRPRLPYPDVAAGFFPDGYIGYATNNVTLLNHDLTATYNRTLNEKISSTTTAGYQIQYDRNHFTSQEGRDLAPFVQTISAAANLFTLPRQSIAERSIWGYFLQQTFSYNEQLFVTLAGRVDGSSAFSADNQNIFYPKASFSYVLSDYWKGTALQKSLGTLKVRASYGQAGNLTGIGPFDRFDNFLLSQLTGLPSIAPSRLLANPDVRPEIMTEFEAGADMSFLNSRVGLNVTYYNQKIDDLLLDRQLPPTVGGSSIVTNVGSMTNNGIELMLQVAPIRTKDLGWDLTALWSRNRNEVSGIDGVLFLRGSDGTQAAISGEQFGLFFGRYYARNNAGNLLLTGQGLAQPERGLIIAESQYNPANLPEGAQRDRIYRAAGSYYVPVRDANGQPTGTELLRVIGDPNPDWFGSFSSDLRYKKLSFRFQFDAFWGADIYNWNRITGNNVGHGKIAEQELKGEVARGYVASIAGGVTGQRIQEEHIEDASWIKLREIALSYNVGNVGKVLQNVNISLIGRNLLSFDSYEGFDPETNSAGQNDRVRGDDFGNVPIPRTIQFRIGAKF